MLTITGEEIDFELWSPTTLVLMPDHGLCRSRISIPLWFGCIHNLAHLFQLILCQIHVPRCKVGLKSRGLGRTRNRNHALSGNPRECDLSNRTISSSRKFLNLLYDSLILVEVLPLKFRAWRK